MRYIFSDIHLGSTVCNINAFTNFLEKVKQESGEGKVEEVIINGDLFESLESRLMGYEWRILSLLRDISSYSVKCIWIVGNHDCPHPETVGNLIGFEMKYEYDFVLPSGKKVLLLHGDLFDDFIKNRRFLTWLADIVYKSAQYFDKRHRLARFLKRNSKKFLRAVDKVREDALQYARRVKADYVICGHTHHAEAIASYYNCGCWTEYHCHYITIDGDNLTLREFC